MNIVEQAAEAIDPEIWNSDGPIPTRADTIAFHSRRQESTQLACEAAETILTAVLITLNSLEPINVDCGIPDTIESGIKLCVAEVQSQLDFVQGLMKVTT